MRSHAALQQSAFYLYPSLEIIMANASLETVLSGQKTILNTLHSLVGISLDSAEKIAAHHVASSRRAVEQHIQQGQAILDSKDVQGVLSLSGNLAQPHIDNGIDYLRGLHDISNEAQEQYISLIESGHGELNKSISSVLDWYSKSAGHADVAVAAVRSAVSAANSAFENAHKTARQVANIADASVKAATSATSRAIDAATPSRKKAA